ncbi:hypothetical protein AB0C77_33510, partial [Streptomyces sp. NPDC048629]|uniref:hypothetical protein n=1 Tax=Streptomyces sp. NPDC048629 TaxID=3154824 RepID=UPI00343BA19F
VAAPTGAGAPAGGTDDPTAPAAPLNTGKVAAATDALDPGTPEGRFFMVLAAVLATLAALVVLVLTFFIRRQARREP